MQSVDLTIQPVQTVCREHDNGVGGGLEDWVGIVGAGNNDWEESDKWRVLHFQWVYGRIFEKKVGWGG